ncbi:MAG: DUF86 domain-containing protein [Gemmatimonadota bacterium]|jgi:uncharacterized protein with HEPN domain|nr:DUF86 domain-containing protein [Gemmatimonadota bacterium]MDQ3607153.1 DUF86 domain-containing protein [Gemmatimonadota bacterium]
MKDDAIYIEHVLESIRRIEEGVAQGRDVFFASHLLQDAVLRNLQTMAESTQRLSQAAKAAYPDVDWQGISAFRNVLVHGYLGINLDRVWEIIHTNLPTLKTAVHDLARRRGLAVPGDE